MKKDNEILDEFGNHLVKEVFDDGVRYLKQLLTNTTKWNSGRDYIEKFEKLDEETKQILLKYVKELLGTFSPLQSHS